MDLRGTGDPAKRVAELEQILASVTVAGAPDEPDESVGFGAKVTVRDAQNQLKTYRILGVDELDLDPNAVSWISPNGKTLLAAELGDHVTLAPDGPSEIVKIEYPSA